MKNSQRGFVVPLLMVIAILIIGSGIYIYMQRKVISSNPNNNITKNLSTSIPAITPSPSVSESPIISDNEAIIQAILNSKMIWTSGDAVKIRAYAETIYADNPKFAAQTKSASDATLLATAALTAKVWDKIDETFLRTKCKITITGNTAKCSWNPTSDTNLTQSVSVKKINGVWQ